MAMTLINRQSSNHRAPDQNTVSGAGPSLGEFSSCLTAELQKRTQTELLVNNLLGSSVKSLREGNGGERRSVVTMSSGEQRDGALLAF